MMNMMPIYFVTKTQLHNFMFKNLIITDLTGLIATCVVVFIVTVLFEALKLLQLYLQLRVRQDSLTYTDNTFNDQADLLTTFNIQQNRKQRLTYHFYGCISHMVNLGVAYFIMLAFMTYNVWLGLSVVLGATTGYFIFGALGNQVTQKFTALVSIKMSELTDSKTNMSTQANGSVSQYI